jgi:hypothetical protein
LAFELRGFKPFLFSIAPPCTTLDGTYSGNRCQVVFQTLSATLSKTVLSRAFRQGEEVHRYTIDKDSTRNTSTAFDEESAIQYYRLLPPSALSSVAISELSQVQPDSARSAILVFALPSLFPTPVAAAAAPPLGPGTTVLGTDTYPVLT